MVSSVASGPMVKRSIMVVGKHGEGCFSLLEGQKT
jgi:hypothetical protein